MSRSSAALARLKIIAGALRANVVANGPVLLRDGAGIAGGLMIAHGVREIYEPAGWIVGGAMLVIAALLIARAQAGGSK